MCPDLDKLRRFALMNALVLLTYSLAGLRLRRPVTVNLLGVPIEIASSQWIGIVLACLAVLSLVRFSYYAIVKSEAPFAARRRLKLGTPGNATATARGPVRVDTAVDREVRKYFPFMRPGDSKMELHAAGATATIDRVRRLTRVCIFLEDADFFAPIWFNVIALTIYGIGFR